MAQWTNSLTYIGLLNQQLPDYGQVAFPATQLPSSDPNTLDDYEEGAVTLGFQFGGAAVGMTYALQSGRYTKIGDRVLVAGICGLTAKGSSTGAARMTGLPFTVRNNADSYAAVSLHLGVITFTGHPQGYAVINTAQIALTNIAAAGGAYVNLDNTNFSNTSEVTIGLQYGV